MFTVLSSNLWFVLFVVVLVINEILIKIQLIVGNSLVILK